MKAEQQNIPAIILTFETVDFTDQSKIKIESFKDVIKSTYIFRVNIPVDSYVEYYDSEFYKILRDNTDSKTKIKFYIAIDKKNTSKPEKVNMYFDKPNTY